MSDEKTTHFGYQQVGVEEKARKVAEVFHSVADKYDVMNDLMSLGIHRLWKRFAVELAGVRRGQQVLDLASGTGDLADLAGLLRLVHRLVAEVGGPAGLLLLFHRPLHGA